MKTIRTFFKKRKRLMKAINITWILELIALVICVESGWMEYIDAEGYMTIAIMIGILIFISRTDEDN